MKLSGKKSAGLRGALALLFIALAGGGAYAFARRDAAPPGRGAVAPVTTVTGAVAPCEDKKVAEKPAKAAEKPAASSCADDELASGEDRSALLALRKAAKARTGASTEAVERLEKIAKDSLEAASKAKDAGDMAAERAALGRVFFALLDREARKPVRARLDELTQKTVFSGRASGDTVYVVKPGDRLISIARSQKVSWSFLKRMNGLKTDSIRVGQKLRIPRGTIELAVFKMDFLLVCTLDGAYLKAWDVGTGREDRTPEAVFKISERIEKPTWYAPDGKVYPFGAKENILGTRWLGFEKTEQFAGFGIHGTAFPETIGTESSAGCIRMRNEDVEEVYDFVPEGTVVTIVR